MKIHKCNQHCITGNPLLSPPPGGGGGLFISSPCEGGLNIDRRFKLYKVDKLKYKKVGVHAAKDQKQFHTSSW